jgi:hypothetical protein
LQDKGVAEGPSRPRTKGSAEEGCLAFAVGDRRGEGRWLTDKRRRSGGGARLLGFGVEKRRRAAARVEERRHSSYDGGASVMRGLWWSDCSARARAREQGAVARERKKKEGKLPMER